MVRHWLALLPLLSIATAEITIGGECITSLSKWYANNAVEHGDDPTKNLVAVFNDGKKQFLRPELSKSFNFLFEENVFSYYYLGVHNISIIRVSASTVFSDQQFCLYSYPTAIYSKITLSQPECFSKMGLRGKFFRIYSSHHKLPHFDDAAVSCQDLNHLLSYGNPELYAVTPLSESMATNGKIISEARPLRSPYKYATLVALAFFGIAVAFWVIACYSLNMHFKARVVAKCRAIVLRIKSSIMNEMTEALGTARETGFSRTGTTLTGASGTSTGASTTQGTRTATRTSTKTKTRSSGGSF
ncbi:unnamed protein product [Auanema sp. JU1783]|nr:unnamed protein product [Auanema sp. JU1783]